MERAMNDLADVQLIDNTWQEAEVVRREIIGIIQALHRDLCAEASSACQQWDAKCRELERRLALVTALVPGAGLLERLACVTEGVRAIPGFAEFVPQTLTDGHMARDLAARIRAWRGDGDGGEEQGGEGDGD